MGTLEDKLDEINYGFPREDYSISRYLLPVMFPEKFGLSFTKKELEEIGARVKSRIKENFYQCVVPTLEYIVAVTGGQYVNLTDETTLIKNEFDYLKTLTDIKTTGLKLSQTAREEIEKVQNSKDSKAFGYPSKNIEMYFHSWKSLFSNKTRKRIRFLLLGKKTTPSLAFKMLDRISDIVYLADNDLQMINYRLNKKKGNTQKILTKEEIQEKSWNFLLEAFKSNQTLQDFFHEKAVEHDLLGPLYEMIGDLFVIDGARGRIVTSRDNIQFINGKIENLPNIDLIKSRCDDFFHTEMKDRAIVFGIVGGKRNKNFGEIRLQTIGKYLEAEFGEYAHFRYKGERVRNLLGQVLKRPFLTEATRNLATTLRIKEESIFD